MSQMVHDVRTTLHGRWNGNKRLKPRRNNVVLTPNTFLFFYTQLAHDVQKMLLRRRFNILTSFDVCLTSFWRRLPHGHTCSRTWESFKSNLCRSLASPKGYNTKFNCTSCLEGYYRIFLTNIKVLSRACECNKLQRSRFEYSRGKMWESVMKFTLLV